MFSNALKLVVALNAELRAVIFSGRVDPAALVAVYYIVFQSGVLPAFSAAVAPAPDIMDDFAEALLELPLI